MGNVRPVDIGVRAITDAELLAWTAALQIPFFDTADPAESVERRRRRTDLERAYGAFAAGRVVGTLRSFASDLTVPGGARVSADAVTAVTVLPTHRRRGALTAMMSASQQASADRGDAVRVLIASEWLIYGRFGFGAATDAVDYTIDVRQGRFVRPAPALSFEFVDAKAALDLLPPVYDATRASTPGSIGRPGWWWEIATGMETVGHPPRPAPWIVVCRGEAGAVLGYLTYRAEEIPDTWSGGRLVVEELQAVSAQAYAGLWRFACGVDLVATVKADARAVDEALPWLFTDARAVTARRRYDKLWVRLLDVPAALEARGCAAAGRVVVEVLDEAGPASGRYEIDSDGGPTRCRRTSCSAELTLPAGLLGAAYLGGQRVRTLAAAGLVDEHSPGAVGRLDAMLDSRTPPWCATHF